MKNSKNKDQGKKKKNLGWYFQSLDAGKISPLTSKAFYQKAFIAFCSLSCIFSLFSVSERFCVDEYLVCFHQFSHGTKILGDCCLDAAWTGSWWHYFTLENILYVSVPCCHWQGGAMSNKTVHMMQVVFIHLNLQMWWFNKIPEFGVKFASWRKMKVAL